MSRALPIPDQTTSACDARAAESAVIERHRAIWRRKPALASIYAQWFERVLADLPRSERVLEVGAGPGFLSEYARQARPDLHWLASDYLFVPGNQLVADAMRLPVRDATIGAVVGFDMLHHLARPGRFLSEASRVLRPHGTLVLIEPWLTALSYPIYHLMHHEVCRPGDDPWRPFEADESHAKRAFEGNSAVPWSMLRGASASDWAALGLAPPQVELFNSFAYLLSLGFREAHLLPGRAATSALLRFDRWAQPGARWLAFRARLRWVKLAS